MNLFTDNAESDDAPTVKATVVFQAKDFYIEKSPSNNHYVLMVRRTHSTLWRSKVIPAEIVEFATTSLKVLRTFKGYVARVKDVRSIPHGVRWTRAKGDFWIETAHPSPPRFDAFKHVHTFSKIADCDQFIQSTLAPKVGEYAKRGRMISFKDSATLADAIRFSARTNVASYTVLNCPIDSSVILNNVNDQLAAVTTDLGVENRFVVSINQRKTARYVDERQNESSFYVEVDWTHKDADIAFDIMFTHVFVFDKVLGLRLCNRFDAIENPPHATKGSLVSETIYSREVIGREKGIYYVPKTVSRYSDPDEPKLTFDGYASVLIRTPVLAPIQKEYDGTQWSAQISILDRTEAEMFLAGRHPVINLFEGDNAHLPHVMKLHMTTKEFHIMMKTFLHSNNSPVTGKWSISVSDRVHIHFEKAEDATLFKVSML